MVTETDEIARALEAAQRAWPEETSRARLLGRLALLGSHQLDVDDQEAVAARRRRRLHADRGSMRGLFPTGYRDQLRHEWPE